MWMLLSSKTPLRCGRGISVDSTVTPLSMRVTLPCSGVFIRFTTVSIILYTPMWCAGSSWLPQHHARLAVVQRWCCRDTRLQFAQQLYFFHTVGPIVDSGQPTEPQVVDLKKCYRSCIEKAGGKGPWNRSFLLSVNRCLWLPKGSVTTC